MKAEVYKDIIDERVRQDKQWGGADHDDEHLPRDWTMFIEQYTSEAWDKHDDPDAYRKAMVKVAALAIAAIESTDRKNG
jgi:quinol monooxygenase YgiN